MALSSTPVRLNSPLPLVTTASVVPLTFMVAPGSGPPFSSVTIPFILLRGTDCYLWDRQGRLFNNDHFIFVINRKGVGLVFKA
jgi:hypothetical protein